MIKSLKIILSIVMIFALAVIVVFSSRYLAARHELSSLKEDLAASTAAWKDTNERKLAVQKELKAVKNDLREAELTITDNEEHAAELNEEIETLEAEIEALRKQIPDEQHP